MAKLAIYNGKALDREVELHEGTLRIGRSDQNDIVLSDASKAVSRFHAELRVENGQCTIADLNSQNGTWVAGRRVQQANVAPGTAMLLGTYRLVVNPAEKPDEAAAQTMALPAAESGSMPSQASAMTVVAPPPPVCPTSLPAPPPMVPDSSAGPVRKRVPPRPGKPRRPGSGKRVAALAAACVCLLLTGFAAGVFWWPSSAASTTDGQSPADPQAVPGGPPTETRLPQPPAQAPVQQPAAGAVAPAPGEAMAAPVVEMKASGGANTSKDTSGSKNGGDPKAREPNAARVLERARSAVKKGDYTSALAGLESILRVDAGDPDALDLLASLRAQGQDAFKRGRQLDAAGRTPEAVRMYEKTVKLLPEDHPSARTARERLTVLREP